jgi:hypothetical protein
MATARGGCGARAARASRVLAIVLAFGATLLITAPAAVATGVSTTFAQATEVAAPSNAGTTPPAPQGGLDGISCTSERKCTAVGSYEDSSGNGQAMEAAETNGRWGQAAEVIAPANAATNPDASLGGISCTSAGNCVAVGSYLDSSGNGQPMEATETSGTWGQAAEITAPTNAGTDPNAVLKGVSCTSAGNCTAVGTYEDSSGNGQAMEATETSGTWGQAAEITAPSNAGTNPEALLYSISCTSAGNCVGVGSYLDSSSHVQAMEATEIRSTWEQATEVTAPSNAGANPEAALKGISCTSVRKCTAVGQYVDSYGNGQAMEATEIRGTWGQATEVTAPSNAGANPNAKLYAVSCTSARKCTAVGTFEDTSSHPQAMEATEIRGTWEQATEVTAPVNAAANPEAALKGISCTSARKCTAVGQYVDSYGNGQAMEATEIRGTWGQATEVTAPSNAGANPNAKLYAVSCTSARKCTAVGTFEDTSSHPQAMEATEIRGTWEAAQVTAPPNAGTNPQADLSAISCTSASRCTAVGEYVDSSGRFQAMAASRARPHRPRACFRFRRSTAGDMGPGQHELSPRRVARYPQSHLRPRSRRPRLR